jgi:hypothetical protein
MDEIRAIDSLLLLFSFTAAKKRNKTTKTRKKERERKQTNSDVIQLSPFFYLQYKRMRNSFFDYYSFLFSFFFPPDISIPFAVR